MHNVVFQVSNIRCLCMISKQYSIWLDCDYNAGERGYSPILPVQGWSIEQGIVFINSLVKIGVYFHYFSKFAVVFRVTVYFSFKYIWSLTVVETCSTSQDKQGLQIWVFWHKQGNCFKIPAEYPYTNLGRVPPQYIQYIKYMYIQ